MVRESIQTNLQHLGGWFALTIAVVSEISYWERPGHILKPMKTFICKQKVFFELEDSIFEKLYYLGAPN